VAQVAVCSQINTKHINTVWAERTVVGASYNEQLLKGKFYISQGERKGLSVT